MKLNEITRLPHVSKNDDELKAVFDNVFDINNYKSRKHLGSFRKYNFYLYSFENTDDLVATIRTLSGRHVGAVYLQPIFHKDKPVSYVTHSVQIKQQFQGRGLGPALYKMLIKAGIILISSDKQSTGGESIWKKLHSNKSNKIQSFDLDQGQDESNPQSFSNFSKPIKSWDSMYGYKNRNKRFVAFK